MKCNSKIEVINGVSFGVHIIDMMTINEFKTHKGLRNENGTFRSFKFSNENEIKHPDSGNLLATVDKKYSTWSEIKQPVFKHCVNVEVNSNGEFLNKNNDVWNRRIETTSDMKILGEPYWVYSEKSK